MNRPPVEVADIVRTAGQKFIEGSREWITTQHVKVLKAIERCRTAALGGHIDECQCPGCGYRAPSYNSCRDRHCPKCQANARQRWIQGRRKELLPVPYAHVVFTVPRILAQLALQNKKLIYTLLLRLSAETLIEVARNPQHLGAEIGFFSVLHTWTQRMEHHPHVHCVVPAGGLSFDHRRWVFVNPRHRFFLPKKVLGKLFRGKLRTALEDAFAQRKIGFHGQLQHLSDPKAFHSFVRQLFRHDWVVHCKRPFGCLANRHRARLLPLCFQCLGSAPDTCTAQAQTADGPISGLWRCPKCGGPMIPILLISRPIKFPRSPPAAPITAQEAVHA